MIVIDTHILIWLVSDPDKLSSKAQKLLKEEEKEGVMLVSSISIWEIYLLVEKGRLSLSMDTDSWVEKLEQLPFLQFVPVDNRIAAKSVTLPGELHADPADRIIIATARERGAVLVTSDEKIRLYPHVQALW